MLVFLLFSLPAFFYAKICSAQVGITLGYFAVKDENTFKNYERIPDTIHQPYVGFSISSQSMNNGVRLNYQFSPYIFQDNQDRRFVRHSAGLLGFHHLKDGIHSFFWGVNYGLRLNQQLYDYLDDTFTDASLRYRFISSGFGIWSLGGQFRIQTYKNLPSFDFQEGRIQLSHTFSLPTRTSIITTVESGMKNFTNALTVNGTEEVFEGRDFGQSRGKGKGKGTDIEDPDSVEQTIRIAGAGQQISQALARLRIAQSLGNRTGLALEGEIQRKLSGNSRVLNGQDSGYETGDLLFDDPYSYDSESISAELTWLLTTRLKWKLGGEVMKKLYDYAPTDLEGNSIAADRRRDRYILYWSSLALPLAIGSRFFTVEIAVSYQENESNAPYYTFNGLQLSGGIQIQ